MALGVSTASRGVEGIVAHSAGLDAQNSTHPIGARAMARAPIGWVEFCASRPAECATIPSTPRDAVLTPKAINELVSVNRYVNEAVNPMTDLEHWGTIEKWSYPDDGYGDCEDYVLLKRRLLVKAGWPRE